MSLFRRKAEKDDGRWVHPDQHEIVKPILPRNPPRRGDIVLVDGEKHRVEESNFVYTGWESNPAHPGGRRLRTWKIIEPGLYVKPTNWPKS